MEVSLNIFLDHCLSFQAHSKPFLDYCLSFQAHSKPVFDVVVITWFAT